MGSKSEEISEKTENKRAGKERAIMKRWIPLEKQSKKAQKEYHDKQRRSWNGVCPVTRVAPSRKAYDRSRIKQEDRQGRGGSEMQG